MKQFSHIELFLVRNPEWLKEHEKLGFILSESFPLAKCDLPKGFENMNATADFDRLKQILQEYMAKHNLSNVEEVKE